MSKKPITKRAGGVDQGESSESKPQYTLPNLVKDSALVPDHNPRTLECTFFSWCLLSLWENAGLFVEGCMRNTLRPLTQALCVVDSLLGGQVTGWHQKTAQVRNKFVLH
jgi:hypothetical protein